MTGSLKSPADDYKELLATQGLHIQRCLDCERAVFFPRSVCPHCGHPELRFQPTAGDGVIYSATVVNRKPDRGGPYNVVLVDLSEGIRMMSRIVNAGPDEVRIGAAVRALVEIREGEPVLLFEMVGQA